MRQFGLITVLLLCGLVFPGAARAQDRVEVFGGYSYMHQSVVYNQTVLCPGINCPIQNTGSKAVNMNGWELTGVYNLYRFLGIAADFGGEYGSVHGASAHVNYYLFGPQVRWHGPVSPFAHFLIGAAHESVGGGASNAVIVNPTSSTDFALALGAGIDTHLAPFLSFRPIQIDYVVTRFGSGTQSQPRVSAGLMVHF